MSDVMAKEIRLQYDKAFATIRGIAEAFPEDKWREPHGDDFYVPCRVIYHLAAFIDQQIAGGFQDPDFAAKLPFGPWQQEDPKALPGKEEMIAYFDEVTGRAREALAALDDESFSEALEPQRARLGECRMGAYIYFVRELSAHTGELNKMLVDDGEQDIWIFR